MSALRIACIGEAMVEIALDRDNPELARVGFAGDTLNTAIYLKRCAPALDVSYVTRLGEDNFSDRLLTFMQSEGLDTALVGRSRMRTPGLYAISTDETGERTFSYWRDTSAARTLFEEGDPGFDDLSGFDVIYMSAISLAILTPTTRRRFWDWLQSYRRAGGRFAFDSNYRPKLWPDRPTARDVIAHAWTMTDIAMPSIDDEMALFGDDSAEEVLQRLRGYGVTVGALKRGADGPVSIAPDGLAPKFKPVGKVVDSTAAGDSFNGAFLAKFLSGSDQETCLRAGHDLAARVIQVKGAILPRT